MAWVEDFFGMMNWKANNFRIPIIKSMQELHKIGKKNHPKIEN